MYIFIPYPPYTVYSTTHTTKSNENQWKMKTRTLDVCKGCKFHSDFLHAVQTLTNMPYTLCCTNQMLACRIDTPHRSVTFRSYTPC